MLHDKLVKIIEKGLQYMEEDLEDNIFMHEMCIEDPEIRASVKGFDMQEAKKVLMTMHLCRNAFMDLVDQKKYVEAYDVYMRVMAPPTDATIN